ncbi:MAG TPA: BlaI/MecI/CopY family transcriptional regulator [Bryobacteraceae bacterium]|nr:BlaI/MecI/CopY family transcriptional regulator [Bryobacteraceae bacterium]
MRNDPQPAKALSDLESLIMRWLWDNGPATSEVVREALAHQHPMKDATVRTILRRLEEKGYVDHTVEGRTYIYRGLHQPENVAAGALRQLIDRFCGGSVEQLLVGMVNQKVISPRELKELANKIESKKGKLL